MENGWHCGPESGGSDGYHKHTDQRLRPVPVCVYTVCVLPMDHTEMPSAQVPRVRVCAATYPPPRGHQTDNTDMPPAPCQPSAHTEREHQHNRVELGYLSLGE